ncbi:sensor histidine kinase [Clostridium fungisolvens]|uniref:histidine kinase n=1 Tax=Clostridium fungisolvens TaxID=1604897 RepID=A0A6V8SLR8_9CLOT|nr:PocR ligand-binding domain-containing protein [Clostridium fungisolvens]GFP76118.1 Sensor histidine kinase RcsC [Clostridium fungisolvens]
MGKINFSEVFNIDSFKKMSESLYEASGIPVGLIDVDGTIYIKTGWQDICTKFHRVHPTACSRCLVSDKYINDHLKDGRYIEYKCLNNMWDIGVPIIIYGQHVATIFMGQFFYKDEEVDVEFFKRQAREFNFDEEQYIAALSKVPRWSRKKVKSILDYYLALVTTLAESGVRQLEYESSQKELAKNQKYLDTIFNSVNDAIFINDFNGNIVDANRRSYFMFNYPEDQLKKMNIIDMISSKSGITKEKMLKTFNKATNTRPIVLECICKTKNNDEFWAEFNISAIKFEKKEEIVVSIRDITDRKLSELALQEEAYELENLRTEFFANISHELRTPLNIIFGAIQVIGVEIENKEKTIDKAKILNNLSVEKQNCFRLLRLINNLIDSTKLDSGYFELNMVNCNIVNIVEEITLSVADYINNNNLDLIFDTEIEEKIMACDLDKIERIMLNLLSNAVKFTPDGGKIFVNIIDGEEYITITVEDTGIGIPSQKLNVIFDRFRQVDKTFIRRHEGSGIGLSLVKSLVEMHNGTIYVESKYGIGTKFSVKLPVKVLNDGSLGQWDENKASSKENYVERIKIEFSDIYK